MKNLKLVLVSFLALAMIPWVGAVPGSAQNQSTALERGYRTGYSDGYNSGFHDKSNGAPREFQSKDDYQRADRSFNEVWGPIEDYRDGYQQGFEAGYVTGYDRQIFNSSIPAGLKRRPPSDARVNDPGAQNSNQDLPVGPTANSGNVNISRDSVFLVEMLSSLSTDATQRGDRFQARVIEPREFENAIIEGRVTAVKRPGRVKGVAELQLAFDTIRLQDNRTAAFNADVIEVVQMGNDGVGTVDPEGGVRGKDSTKDDVAKVGAATGIGAIIGAIVGGGQGAAIGAAIGGGVGAGGVMRQRGKDIRLERGQQLRVRTATETHLEARN
jgi:hypothetical protein